MNKKKFLAMTMATAIALSAFTGCFGDGNDDDDPNAGVNSETNAIVGIYYGGYGVDAMKKIAKAFNAEQSNLDKGWTVSISDQGGGFMASNVTSKLQGGIGDFDMLLTANVSVYNIVDRGSSYLNGYDCALEELTDVYESKVFGEDVFVKDKMVDQFYEYNTFKGKQYSFNWATGPSGLAYRADYFKKEGWQIPRTTDELIEVSNQMLAKGYTPYVWSTQGSYWYYSVLAWWRQLIDDTEFDDFWNGLDSNGELAPEAFKSQARLQAFEQLEEIMAGPNGAYRTDGHFYTKSGAIGANDAQLALYNSANKVCMMANSDWLENEMKASEIEPGDVDVGLFRTPVTSKILKIYNAQYPNGTNRFQTITTEAKLREVITSIDEGKTSHDGVSAEDFAALKKIRSYTGTEGQNHIGIVPAFANAKDVAKEFLRYLGSDKAMQIYYDEVGTFLPFETSGVTANTTTTFRKDVYNMSKNAHYVSTFDSKNPIFYKTNLNYFMTTKIEQYIATTSANDQMSGREYWEFIYNKAVQEWDTALAQSKD